jgi:hypothetical protein
MPVPIRSRGAHKATSGGFSAWAAGGNSSGPSKNRKRGGARVGTVTDRKSGTFKSATLDDQRPIGSVRRISGSSSPQSSSQSSSPYSKLQAHVSDYDSDSSSLQSTSIVADADLVPGPDELFAKLGTARSSISDDDDEADGKLFPKPGTGKVGLEEA